MIFEIETKDIKLSVNEALAILHSATNNEPLKVGGGCTERSASGMICCRGKNHEGLHIATGTEEIYEIWKGKIKYG